MLSANFEEMKQLVDKVRLFEQMRGNGIKFPIGDEVKNRKNNRKSIVSVRAIKQGERIEEKDIDIKRPGTGIEPKYKDIIIGKSVVRDIKEDSLLQWSDLS